jgi:Kef-type K+ transport systems, membrane components
VLLGGSVLGVVPHEGLPGDAIHLLAELGVLLLLFEIGLETDLREMFRVGPASLAVAVVGVIAPFGLGYAYWASTGHSAAVRDLRRRHPHRDIGRYHRPGAVRPGPDGHPGSPHHHRRGRHR